MLSLASANTITPWLAARNTAVIALLYGCGLRISEALDLKRENYPFPEIIKVQGKGIKNE